MSQRCTRCNKSLALEKFEPKKSNGSYCAWCDSCRAKKKSNMDKNKCQHGKRRNDCRDCGGSSFVFMINIRPSA